MNVLKIDTGKIKLDAFFAIYLLIAIWALLVFRYVYVWVPIILFGFILTQRNLKIEIDIENSKIRRCISIFKIKLPAHWKDIPEMKYITIAKAFTYYTVKIVVNHKMRFVNLQTLKKDEAIKLGLKVGETLDLKVLDHTTREENWIR